MTSDGLEPATRIGPDDQGLGVALAVDGESDGVGTVRHVAATAASTPATAAGATAASATRGRGPEIPHPAVHAGARRQRLALGGPHRLHVERVGIAWLRTIVAGEAPHDRAAGVDNLQRYRCRGRGLQVVIENRA